MIENGAWHIPLYQETSVMIFGFLVVMAALFFFLRKRSQHFAAGWASVTSWFIAAPLILGVFGLSEPWPLLFLVMVGIFSAKTFFQLVGMYHRSWFVWVTYLFIFSLGYMIYENKTGLFNFTPMLFLLVICLIPILRNSATHMIQYLALAQMAFIFFGWSLMHMARLLVLPNGIFIVLYLYILTEFSEAVALFGDRFFGRFKPLDRISPRMSIEGLLATVMLTLLLAWGIRHLLPDRSEQFWIASGLVAAIVGRMGDLTLSVVRRDLGIKDTGVFIIGRGDILARVDKLMFVAPLFYYIYLYLNNL